MEIKIWKSGMSDADEAELIARAQKFADKFVKDDPVQKIMFEMLTLIEEKQHSKHVGYWERNMLALLLADGWYNDDIEEIAADSGRPFKRPRYARWRRVLSLFGGRATFHVPDDFDVGNLKQIERNWDGHTTPQKWEFLWMMIQAKGPSLFEILRPNAIQEIQTEDDLIIKGQS